jgi:hypothetical protein
MHKANSTEFFPCHNSTKSNDGLLLLDTIPNKTQTMITISV